MAVVSACYLCCTLHAPHIHLHTAWEAQSRRVLCYWLNQNHEAEAPLYGIVAQCPWKNVIHSHPHPVLLPRVTLLQICSSIGSVFRKKDWSRELLRPPDQHCLDFLLGRCVTDWRSNRSSCCSRAVHCCWYYSQSLEPYPLQMAPAFPGLYWIVHV